MSTDSHANMQVADRDLKYYIFDWDDNILHMPTHIHLEKKLEDGNWVSHSVSTAVYSVIRSDTEHYRPPNGDWEQAFIEFRDFDDENQNVFLRDTQTAIDRVMGGDTEVAPSFRRFSQTLLEGRLFAIVTARGHSPEIIRAGVEYFIEHVLSPREREQMLVNLRGYIRTYAPNELPDTDDGVIAYYLDHCKYHGVMSSHFKSLMADAKGDIMPGTEGGKQFAIRDFLEHVIHITRRRGMDKPISVGFSDDDVGNARAVEDYIRAELARQFPNVKFVVYYTADPETPSGRKVVVQGQLTLGLGKPGASDEAPE